MLIACIYLYFVINLVFANQLPSDIEKCNFGDVKCITSSMNYVLKHYGKMGIPSMKLPSLSQYKLEPINLIQADRSTPIWYEGKIDNILIKGLENITITKVIGFGRDPMQSDSEIHGTIPSLVVTTKFDFKFKLFNIPLKLAGNSVADLQKFQFKTKMSFISDDRGYAKIYKCFVKTKSDRWITDLTNVNSDNTDLTVLITQWINENWFDLWQDAEPTVRSISQETFSTLMNNIFTTIRYEDMFQKSSN